MRSIRGDLVAAERPFSAALCMLAVPEVRDWAATATSGLGFVAELSGDLTTAERHHREAYLLASDAGPVGAAARAVAVEGPACVAAARGRPWRRHPAGNGADAHRPATPFERHDIERAADRARALLGLDAYETAQAAASLSCRRRRSRSS